jgi:hypothetical protein
MAGWEIIPGDVQPAVIIDDLAYRLTASGWGRLVITLKQAGQGRNTRIWKRVGSVEVDNRITK